MSSILRVEELLERSYFTGSVPFLSTSYSSKTCGGPDDAFTSTTVFEKCGDKLALEGRNTMS